MKENRSIFWPLTLIAAGTLWLLITMHIVPAENLWALTHIWPYLLIALGVGLILRSFWKPFSILVSVLVVAGAMAAVLYAPKLGWADAPDWQVHDNFDGAIPGSGVIAKETRKVAGFDAISIRIPAETTITQGNSESVIVEAEDNYLPQLTTSVKSGTLVIENTEDNWSERVNPKEIVRITIIVKNLNEINFSSAGTLVVEDLTSTNLSLHLSGAGEVTLSHVKLDSLDVNLSGAGTIHANGEANNVSINISGLGSFDGKGLTSQVADVVISGAGSAALRVEKELTARVSGAGSVNYFGDPKVTRQISGAGSINKAGN